MAEIGDAKRFESGKKIASWAGLCPSVYQTADENLTGRVKQGSKNLRRMMVQVAHVASRVDCRFRRFYLGVLARRGKKKAVVALARKILCIIRHLLVNGEGYVEEGLVKSSRFRVEALAHISLEEMAEVLRGSGYMVQFKG